MEGEGSADITAEPHRANLQTPRIFILQVQDIAGREGKKEEGCSGWVLKLLLGKEGRRSQSESDTDKEHAQGW